jgi:hypothetical protein
MHMGRQAMSALHTTFILHTTLPQRYVDQNILALLLLLLLLLLLVLLLLLLVLLLLPRPCSCDLAIFISSTEGMQREQQEGGGDATCCARSAHPLTCLPPACLCFTGRSQW